MNSGTAALALALLAARSRQPQIERPEVLVPGYGCPNLIAAAEYAGVHPVLVDIGADDPGYDLECLRSALSPNTVAIVAVNFLGIRERLSDIRQMLQSWPAVMLIEDDAQWFPEPAAGSSLEGDAVCLSFGRGKPVSLLGGGALLLRHSLVDSVFLDRHVFLDSGANPVLRWKARVYNLLLRPSLYGLLSRNPLLSLGRTVFKPLHGIYAMDSARLDLLPANVRTHLARGTGTSQRLQQALPSIMDLPAKLGSRAGRLLRYPLLCNDSRQRETLWKSLGRAGLGSSAMYQRPLPSIEGVQGKVEVRGELNGARHFAARLLTLPVHEGVRDGAIRRIQDCLHGN